MSEILPDAQCIAHYTDDFPHSQFSFGFASVQPSEFLKPGFMVVIAWLTASSQDLNGPPGKFISFALTVTVVLFLAFQPDFGQAMLVLFGWGVIYFVSGAPMILIVTVMGLTGVGGFAVAAERRGVRH